MDKSLPARIEVKSPFTHNTWDQGKYVTYEIKTETEHSSFHLKSSSTRRRFSDFVWLRQQLRKHHPHMKAPNLPSRKLMQILFRSSDDSFLESRRLGLEKFINQVQAVRLYQSDSTFHLFVQTDLTCEQIGHYLTGQLPDKELNRVWQAGGVQGDILGLEACLQSDVGGDKLRVESQSNLKQTEPGTDSGLGGDNSSIGGSSLSSQEDNFLQWPNSSRVSCHSPQFSINGEDESCSDDT